MRRTQLLKMQGFGGIFAASGRGHYFSFSLQGIGETLGVEDFSRQRNGASKEGPHLDHFPTSHFRLGTDKAEFA